jgi:hypothetical protein
VFVEATLDPNGSDDILRIQDSIVFLTNGNLQDIDLVAWGQDVHMIGELEIEVPTLWEADKPYLIIDYVYVDSLASLTLDPGVRVYLHKDAMIYVDGSLQLLGTRDDPIGLSGDRLEEFYDQIPGQWGFIYLSGSSYNNRIVHAEIRNGTIGVLISAPPRVRGYARPGNLQHPHQSNELQWNLCAQCRGERPQPCGRRLRRQLSGPGIRGRLSFYPFHFCQFLALGFFHQAVACPAADRLFRNPE